MMQRMQRFLSVAAASAALPGLLLVTMGLCGPFCQAAEHNAPGRFALEMPRDPSMPVVTMSFVNSHVEIDPSQADLSIYSDGRVTATSSNDPRRAITARLPRSEWEKLQRILFVQNDLLACDTADLEHAIHQLRRQRRRPQPGPEAAVTIIRVRSENFTHGVRCHAVGLTATQLPDLPDVQRLFACQQCLQNVVQVVRAGGYDEVERTLDAVNTRLRQQLPGYDPLSSDHLKLVDARPDGTRYLQFSRMPCPHDDRRALAADLQPSETFLMVSVYDRPGRPLEISITGDPVYR